MLSGVGVQGLWHGVLETVRLLYDEAQQVDTREDRKVQSQLAMRL